MIQVRRLALPLLLVPGFLLFAGCATTGDSFEEGEEPVLVVDDVLTPEDQAVLEAEEVPTGEEGEVPLSVAESEAAPPFPAAGPNEVVVQARVRGRHEVIGDHVAEARALLQDVELLYVF